jgi:serine/threonine-protein kinase
MSPIDRLNATIGDRYRVERELGRGGMATVYLARDLRHDRRVALKVLKPELGAVLGVERFLSEIRVTANLQHPNLLPLFDSGETDGLLYYVMPLVEGESLRNRLDREKQLPVEEAVRIASAIGHALEHAHAQGVIHRDLKPENILLQSGQPVVADFGIALAVANAGGTRVTQTGLSLGTPQYMSPEQATGDHAIDGRSDIYSLAALTYEMLTGEPPHTGTTAQAIIARVLTEQPRSVRVARPSVPEHVEVAITRALAKLPADRWASAAQFADALQGRLAVDRRTMAALGAGRTDGRARFKDPVVVGALLLALLGTAYGVRARRSPVEDSDSAIRFELTFPDGEGLAAAPQLAISPDGKSLVYIGLTAAGERTLFQRDLTRLSARALPGTNAGTQPIFSPDGGWVAFDRAGEISKVNLATGSVIRLARMNGTLWGMAWGANDVIVASMGQRLHTIPATGGEPKPLTQLDSAGGELAQREPRLLPDGETVLFHSWRTSSGDSKIGIASLTTGQTRYLDIADAAPIGVLENNLIYATGSGQVMAAPFDARRDTVTGPAVSVGDQVLVTGLGLACAWLSKSGSLVYGTGSTTGQMVVTDAQGTTTTIVADPQYYSSPRFSPDGKRIAYASGTASSRIDIWIYDIAAKTATKLTSDGIRNQHPEWTPDGKAIIYISNRNGTWSLWRRNADFSGTPELLQAGRDQNIQTGVLSPNHQYLVYKGVGASAGSGIWYRRLSGDTASRPLAASEVPEYAPQFSRDGKWVAYSATQSGSPQIFVQPFPPTGARYQVSNSEGTAPMWSRDGKRIYYQSGPQLRVAYVQTAPAFAVTARDSLLQSAYFNVRVFADYDVAPGGGVLWLRSLSADEPTIVVHNWKYELRKRLGGKN